MVNVESDVFYDKKYVEYPALQNWDEMMGPLQRAVSVPLETFPDETALSTLTSACDRWFISPRRSDELIALIFSIIKVNWNAEVEELLKLGEGIQAIATLRKFDTAFTSAKGPSVLSEASKHL